MPWFRRCLSQQGRSGNTLGARPIYLDGAPSGSDSTGSSLVVYPFERFTERQEGAHARPRKRPSAPTTATSAPSISCLDCCANTRGFAFAGPDGPR